MGKYVMAILGKMLCAIGLHDAVFSRYWRGMWRPHFYCRRKGCNYWNG